MALIQPFRKLSVKRKLQAIIMSTVIAALLLSCGALLVSQAVGLRGSMKANLQILARMIAENSTAALSFEDQPAARELLRSLDAQPAVRAAGIYSADGKLFARDVRQRTGGGSDEFVRQDRPGQLGNHGCGGVGSGDLSAGVRRPGSLQ